MLDRVRGLRQLPVLWGATISGELSYRCVKLELGSSVDAEAAIALFASRFAGRPAVGASAPGRVNLIGEHTDYNGGPVLPLAISGRTAVLAARAAHWDVVSAVDGQVRRLDPAQPRGDWTDYLSAVIRVLAGMKPGPPPAAIAVASTVPIGAGLSSSAALCVAAVKVLALLAGRDLSRSEIAEVAYRAEHDEVGVSCGRMDQTIAACARPHQALYFETRTGETRYVPLRCRIWILETGVAHRLSEGGLNARVQECAAALRQIQASGRTVQALAELGPAEVAHLAGVLPPVLLRRVRHVVTETARTRRAVELLAVDDFAGVGALLLEGHESLSVDYESSCPEADFLVHAAQQAGAYGARLTGAGWGGAVIMLAPAGTEEAIASRVAAQFTRAFGREARFWSSWACEGVREVKLQEAAA